MVDMNRTVSVIYSSVVILVLIGVIGYYGWNTYDSRDRRIQDFLIRSEDYAGLLSESLVENRDVNAEVEFAEKLMAGDAELTALQVYSPSDGLRISVVKPAASEFRSLPLAGSDRFSSVFSRIRYRIVRRPMPVEGLPDLEAYFLSVTLSSAELRNNLLIILITILGLLIITLGMIFIRPSEKRAGSKASDNDADSVTDDSPEEDFSLPDDFSEDLPDDLSDDLSDDFSDDLSDDMSDDLTDDFIADLSDNLSDDLSDNLSDDLSGDAADDLPDDFSDDLPADANADLPGDPSDDFTVDLPDDLSDDLSADAADDLPGDLSDDFTVDLPDDLSDDLSDDSIADLPEDPSDDFTVDLPDDLSADAAGDEALPASEDFDFGDFDDADKLDENDLWGSKPEVGDSVSLDEGVDIPVLDDSAPQGAQNAPEAELLKRLEQELEQAASVHQDLSVIVFSGSDENRGIQESFPNQDMIFNLDKGRMGVIESSKNLDEALDEAKTTLRERIEGEGGQSVRVGIASRNGRLISAENLWREAESALLKADDSANVVAFRADPEKYRRYLKEKSR